MTQIWTQYLEGLERRQMGGGGMNTEVSITELTKEMLPKALYQI